MSYCDSQPSTFQLIQRSIVPLEMRPALPILPLDILHTIVQCAAELPWRERLEVLKSLRLTSQIFYAWCQRHFYSSAILTGKNWPLIRHFVSKKSDIAERAKTGYISGLEGAESEVILGLDTLARLLPNIRTIVVDSTCHITFSQLNILPTLAKFPSLRRIDVLSENMHPWTIPHMLAKLSLVRQWYISGVKVKGVSALREVRQGPIESLALVNIQGNAWDLYDTLAHTLRDCPLHSFKTVFAIGRVPTLTFNRLLSVIGPRLRRMALVFSSHVASEEYHGHGPRGGIDWENAIFDTYDVFTELQFVGLHEIRRLVVSLTCNGENLMHILCQLPRPDRLTHLTILLPSRDLLQCSPFSYAEKTDLQLIDDLLSDKYTALKECRIIKASHDEYNMEDLYEDAKAGFPKTLAAGKLHLLGSLPGKGVEDLDDGFLWD